MVQVSYSKGKLMQKMKLGVALFNRKEVQPKQVI